MVVMVVILALAVFQPARADSRRFELVPVVVAELDAESIKTDGNASGWFSQENLAAMVRETAGKTGMVLFAVSGQEFDQVTASQDRIHDSGRYRDANIAPKGQMLAPTVRFSVSIISNQQAENYDGSSFNVNANFSRESIKTTVILEKIGIASGIGSKTYRADATVAMPTNINVGSWNLGSLASSGSGGENELYQKSFEKALQKIAVQIARDFQHEPICPIDVATGKSIVSERDDIAFYRNGQKIAQYEVIVSQGNQLGVRAYWEKYPPKAGDDFKIVSH